jgi:HlyD family secretion protein
MSRRIVPILTLLLVVAAGTAWVLWKDDGEHPFTGFVEGEERVLRSEVVGRVNEVLFEEGDRVPAGAVVARLDEADIAAKLAAKERELGVIDARIAAQEERIALTEKTWQRDVAAQKAGVGEAEAAARLAEQTLRREQELVTTGASTAQLLDDARSRRDQAVSALARTRQLLQRAEARQLEITLAERELSTLREQRILTEARLTELQVTKDKHAIRAPEVETVVQTQFVWPGELAQGGTAILSVLDPLDKYVRIYVPVDQLAKVRVGGRVDIELDSEPGRRVPGEVVFVADQASFTPEKIQTRDDRIGQVYRVKVRILEDVARLRAGTEGNVFLVAGDPEESPHGG